jgi:hypothetical protein
MNPSEDQQRAIVAEAERKAVAVNIEGLRRDAQRWRWAKEHPRFAVDLFDVQWMEQRDFDASIDAAMQHAAPINPCPNCKRCVFECLQGKWELGGQRHDCYGCDGSGIDTRCEEHREKDA